MARLGEPQFHHRDQAVAARQQACVVETAEQGDGFAEAGRAVVFERSRDQARLPSAKGPVSASPNAAQEGRTSRRTINRP